jgi:O-antigen ligase
MKYLSISFGVVDQSVSISSGVVDRSVSTIFSNTYSGDSSDHERLYSISEGLRLWLHNPLFGGGLGRFMFDELAKNGRPLVIHNTFVWLLAEFGLIGIIPFVLYVWSLFQNLYIRWKNSINIPLTEREKALFLLLVIFGGMSMVHEIFYQRCIWFIAGLLLAKTVQDKKEDFQK